MGSTALELDAVEVVGIGETVIIGGGIGNGFCSAGLGNSNVVGDIEFKLNREGGSGEDNGIETSTFDRSDGLSGGFVFAIK